SAVTQFLPSDLATFAAAQPGIRIELHEADSHEAVLAVLDGRADLGIFAERTPELGLHTLPYRQDQLVLVVPAGHPLARKRQVRFEDAAAYDFVSLSQATSLAQRLQLESRRHGIALRVRIHVRSFDAMCQMVAAGLGIAVLPAKAVRPLVKALGLRQIDIAEDWTQRQLLLGLRDPDALARPVRTLLEHLTAPTAGA
ncbi:MAG TPA: LysR substrate-binding domain-containing protein, partial [Burkholderiaceae bacterium]|nr:LysR substrate-binding domain-containing protein [Burkholderiaceae bacterium]